MFEFEWDENKRLSNIAKHGIDFARAQALFDGRDAMEVELAHRDEVRYSAKGLLDNKFVTVIWTWRGANIRIISARRAQDAESRKYRQLFCGRD